MTVPNMKGWSFQKAMEDNAKLIEKAVGDNSYCPRCRQSPAIELPYEGTWECEMCHFRYHLKII